MINYLKLLLLRRKWRQLNRNNETAPDNLFDINLVKVGKYTYGRLKVLTHNSQASLRIGNFCSIGPGVMFILSADHYFNHISTYPYRAKVLTPGSSEGVSKGNIIVDDDVWIGYGATILSGVHIGQGAVVAAGAVVSHDVPPYAIVGGVPAKVIKYRFNDDIIHELMKVDYSKLTAEMIGMHADDLYKELTGTDQLAWMPKKADS